MTPFHTSVATQDSCVSEPGVKVLKRPTRSRRKKKRAKVLVNEHWTVADIVGRYPQTTEVLAEWGLHCFGCAVSHEESLEEGCLGHGFSEEDIQDMVNDLNNIIANVSPKPSLLHITKNAALAILEIAEREKVEGQGLSLQANSDGSFYMEFREEIAQGEKEFTCFEVPEVKVFASVLTLQRIGGSTIDFRDGRFKLDVRGGCCGATSEGESCSCAQG